MSTPDLSNVINNLIEVFSTDAGSYTTAYSNTLKTKTFTNLIGIGLDANQLGVLRSRTNHPTDVYAIVLKNTELYRREKLTERRGQTFTPINSSYFNFVKSGIYGSDPESPGNSSLNSLSATNLGITRYYLFILSKNSPLELIPVIVPDKRPYHVFRGIERYPTANLSNKKLYKEYGLDMPTGTLVKASYANPGSKLGLTITEIVEDSSVFTQIVCSAMSIDVAQSCVCFAPNAELQGVQHSSGDPLGTEAEIKTLDINGSLIYPYREGATVDLIVFYHGVGYGDQQYVLNLVKQLPVKNTMFLIPNGNSANWSGVESAIGSLSTQYGVTIANKKLAAWSGGSKGFMKANDHTGDMSNYWAAKVLADPSPERSAFGSNLDSIPSRVYMEYNPSNWTDASLPADYDDRLSLLAQKIDLASGESVLVQSSRNNHNDILISALELLNT